MARTDFGGGISPNAYMGGAVRLNSDSFTNYYLQQKGRQDANEDAIAKYTSDLGKNITSAGMHSNDVDDLLKMKNDWQAYGMQNKKAIARPSLDNGKAYQNFTSQYNEMQDLIAKSKDKVKNLAQLHQISMDPAKRSRLTQSTLDDISTAELPIKHPNYKPIDFNSIAYQDKPFDLTDQSKLTGILGKIKGAESVAGVVPDSKTGMQTVTYKNSFSPDQLNGMTNIAHTLYHNHPGFKAMVDKEADPLSNNYDQLNGVFKKHYGRDIGDGEDMATAHVLSMNPNRAGRQVVQKIPIDPMKMLAAREASNNRQFDYREAVRDKRLQQSGNNIDGVLDKMIADSKSDPIKYTTAAGKETREYRAKAVPEDLKMFSEKNPDTKQTIVPDEVHFSEDGKTGKAVFYKKKDEAGNEIVTEPGANRPVDHVKPFITDEFRAHMKKQLAGAKANQTTTTTIIPGTPVAPINKTGKLPKNAFD